MYPASQSHVSAPASELEFVGHPEHSTDPDDEAYVPAEQSRQALSPADFLYLPASQAEHDPPDPAKPTLQEHSLLPAPENELEGQDSQTSSDAAPSSVENLPGSQVAHSPLPVTDLNLPAGTVVREHILSARASHVSCFV